VRANGRAAPSVDNRLTQPQRPCRMRSMAKDREVDKRPREADRWQILEKMNPARLRRLVSMGEGPLIEFKRSTGELREGMEALCGRLNAQGKGRVVFGVSERGEILGQAVAESTQREIANASRRIEPAAEIETSVVCVGTERAVVIVEASAHALGPFTFEGRGYLRVGNTTQRMSHSEFDGRVVARLETQLPWDRWIAPNWRIRDLDRSEILRMVEDAVEAKRLTGVRGEKTEVVLRRLELVTDRGVTRAAAILFGKEGGPGYPMGEVRLRGFGASPRMNFGTIGSSRRTPLRSCSMRSGSSTNTSL